MFKNQLQELAQRSCFNLPSYTCIREGPDHAPRFKAVVNFNGDSFESPSYCYTLRQAEHSAAEVALNALSFRGPSNSLAARILDETGVYKNLLQEVSQRVGASLPIYTTFRTGLGHLPVFTSTVELAKVIFTGEPAKNKKQAEKNAAMEAWLSLKSLVQQSDSSMFQKPHKDEPEHVTVAHALQKYLIKAGFERKCFPIKFPALNPRASSMQQSPATASKILPLICPKIASGDKSFTAVSSSAVFQKICKTTQSQTVTTVSNENLSSFIGNQMSPSNKFHAAGAAPYIPAQRYIPHQGIAPPVTIRNAIPVFSAPPLPSAQSSMGARPSVLRMEPPVSMRQAVAGSVASPDQMEELPSIHPAVKVESPRFSRPPPARVEQLPLSRAASGRLGDSTFFRLPLVRVEEYLGPKLLPVHLAPFSKSPALHLEPPSFEFPRGQIHSPVSSSISSSTRTKPSINETRISVPDVQQESAVIKVLKELKL